MDILQKEANDLFYKALKEDKTNNDITSKACIDKDKKFNFSILLKEEACIAGIIFLKDIFQDIKIDFLAEDGKFYEKGKILASLYGNAIDILSYERTIINFLQHMSGIATYTYKCVKKVKNYKCDVLDTRKTFLGMRLLQKYAVKMGGGKNHRLNLEDEYLIKNNHLSFLENFHKDKIFTAIEKARNLFPNKLIEIEIDDIKFLQSALDAKADKILLDNMAPSQIEDCLKVINKRAYSEASGNITLENIEEYAKTGVDGISIGALTHSVKATNICLRIGEKNE